ncbi:hypothetical protein MJT46_015811 [Ovis ammon polii x Ovis aries]|nr:hypothetical protein MJT46_015811 [Ovis ammon polii x Ovis aries]
MTAEKALPLGNGKAAEEARESEVLSGGGGGAVSARDKRDKAVHERGHWNNKVEFVLSVAGEIIGLGNVWRFPYLCYKNGGGIGYATQVIEAHLNVYYIIILAWAIFYLSNCFTTELPWATCGHEWNTENCVEFQKLNVTNHSHVSLQNATSPVMEFWDLSPLPPHSSGGSGDIQRMEASWWDTLDRRRVLAISNGIEHIGDLRWELALCLLAAWTICYFCIWKGTKSTGKVVYVTATFPYVMLLILLIRGVTLPGASEGVKFYLYPDLSRLSDPQMSRLWSRLRLPPVRKVGAGMFEEAWFVQLSFPVLHDLDLCGQEDSLSACGRTCQFGARFGPEDPGLVCPVQAVGFCSSTTDASSGSPTSMILPRGKVWVDAGTQIFFSYAICLGCLTALGSYNNYNNNCYRDCIMLCCLNSGTSFVAGFAIFSVLGFMAYEQGVPIAEVAESGPGLAFIAYPKAVTMMPLSPLWAALFFMMLIFLGLDSQFVCVESLVTAVVDMYPKVFRRGYRRELLILALSATSYFLGLVMLTEGGMYIFQLFDSYAASGMCLLFVAIFECICIGWVYGSDRFYDNIEDMIGYRPVSLIKWCWKVVTPGICAGIFIFFLVKYKPLKYNNVYTYPAWGYGIGWLMALSSMLCIPVWVCIKVWKTEGTLPERFRKLMIPSADLKMRGSLGAGPRTVAVNDCDAKLKGDGAVAAITEKETHF